MQEVSLAAVRQRAPLADASKIGPWLYRLAVKWGWFEGKDPTASRKRLKLVKWAITVFFLVLGLATLAAYMKIGYEHRALAGQPYVPTWQQAPK